MAYCKTFHHNSQESTKAGLVRQPEFSGGWVPVANINKFLAEEIEILKILEVEKNGHQYCEYKQLLKIIEEHLTLKMISDGCNHF